MEKIYATQFVNSWGNLGTRINPLNRHSKLGFATRMMNKTNRKPRFRRSTGIPLFFQQDK